jgi:hypothetical protein
MKRPYYALAIATAVLAVLAVLAGAASITTNAAYPLVGAPVSRLLSDSRDGATGVQQPVGATPTCAVGGPPGPWTLASPLPQALESTNADADATNAYDAGGYDGTANTVVAQFSRFDPVGNAWTSLPPMPTAADGAATIFANNKVYVFGGADDPGNGLTTTRIYDIATATWSVGAAMPGPRTRFAGKGYFNGKIYLVGGSTTILYSNAQAQTWEFDPVANTWSTSRANMPMPLLTGGTGIVNGHLFVIGGADSTGAPVNTVYDYDIAANTWTTRTPVPSPVAAPGSGVVGNQVFIFGGGTPFQSGILRPSARQSSPAALNTTWIFDTTGYTWSPGPNLNVARALTAGAKAGNYLVAIAGFNGTSDIASTETSLVVGGPCGTPSPGITGTATSTATTQATVTRTPGTPLPVPTSTSTPTSPTSPTNTVPVPPPSATNTVQGGTPTRTSTPGGPSPTRTSTIAPSITPGGPTFTPTLTPTPCTISYSDVNPPDFFYTPVLYLSCHGVVTGYSDGTFRPYNPTTRAQMVKIVVLGFGIPIVTPTAPAYTFTDVPRDHTFFYAVETAVLHNIITGYPCGGPLEPCDSQNRPYFRPGANVTRGQLSKIVVIGAGWLLHNPPSPGTFEDVPTTNTFYAYIETAYCHGIISGYQCGGAGEPCDPENRPYFRPFNDATRGQIAKLQYLAITNPPVDCDQPTPTPALRPQR